MRVENGRRAVLHLPFLLISLALLALSWLCDRVWFELHLTQAFCATETGQLHRLAALRALGVAAAVLIWFVLRPRFLKWFSGTSSGAALRSAARISLAVALALVVSVGILRARHKDVPPGAIPPPALPPLRPDADVGWTGSPHAQVLLRSDEREIPYSFDADGNRISTVDDAIDREKPTILFAGESITEGIGVRWDEMYAAIVGSDLHVQVVAAGTHGYGNAQIYWSTQKQLSKLEHPVAVVTLVIPQLLERDLDPTRPRLVLTPDRILEKIQAEPPPPRWWETSPLRHLARGLFPYHDDSAIDLARAIFSATAKEARAKGAYPLFVLTNWGAPCLPPAAGDPPLSDRLFGGLEVPWVMVTLNPAWQDISTHHPNAKAHRVLANEIEKALTDAKVGTQ